MYLSGRVPIEDEKFKKILMSTVHFIQKVERTLTFGGADQEKSKTLEQLVQAKEHN